MLPRSISFYCVTPATCEPNPSPIPMLPDAPPTSLSCVQDSSSAHPEPLVAPIPIPIPIPSPWLPPSSCRAVYRRALQGLSWNCPCNVTLPVAPHVQACGITRAPSPSPSPSCGPSCAGLWYNACHAGVLHPGASAIPLTTVAGPTSFSHSVALPRTHVAATPPCPACFI